MSQSNPRLCANHSTTRTAWRMTSGPMPSPGRTIRLGRLRIAINPRPTFAIAFLKSRNIGAKRERQLNLFEAFKQCAPFGGINLERYLAARRRDDHLAY